LASLLAAIQENVSILYAYLTMLQIRIRQNAIGYMRSNTDGLERCKRPEIAKNSLKPLF